MAIRDRIRNIFRPKPKLSPAPAVGQYTPAGTQIDPRANMSAEPNISTPSGPAYSTPKGTITSPVSSAPTSNAAPPRRSGGGGGGASNLPSQPTAAEYAAQQSFASNKDRQSLGVKAAPAVGTSSNKGNFGINAAAMLAARQIQQRREEQKAIQGGTQQPTLRERRYNQSFADEADRRYPSRQLKNAKELAADIKRGDVSKIRDEFEGGVKLTTDYIGEKAESTLVKFGVPEEKQQFDIRMKNPGQRAFAQPFIVLAPRSDEEKVSRTTDETPPASLLYNQPVPTQTNVSTITRPTQNITSIMSKSNDSRLLNVFTPSKGQNSIKIGETNIKGLVSGTTNVASFAIPGFGQLRARLYAAGAAENAYTFTYGAVKSGKSDSIYPAAKQYAMENPLQVGLTALSLGFGTYRAGKYLTTPLITAEAVPATQRTFLATVDDKGTGLKSGTVYVNDYTPPRFGQETNRLRNLFGREPKQILVTPAQDYNTAVPFVMNDAASRGVAGTKRASNTATLTRVSEVTGRADEVSENTISSMSKPQKYVYDKFTKQGTPRTVDENTRLFFTEGTATKGAPLGNPNIRLNRYSGSQKEVAVNTRPPTVNEVTKGFGFAEVREVKSASNLQLFSVQTADRTTKTLSPRAGGKVTSATGFVIVRSSDEAADDAVNVITGVKPRPTTKQVQDQQTAASIASMATKTPKPSAPKPSVKLKSEESFMSYPMIVGGAGKATSSYYGKGGVVSNDVINQNAPMSLYNPVQPTMQPLSNPSRSSDSVSNSFGLGLGSPQSSKDKSDVRESYGLGEGTKQTPIGFVDRRPKQDNPPLAIPSQDTPQRPRPREEPDRTRTPTVRTPPVIIPRPVVRTPRTPKDRPPRRDTRKDYGLTFGYGVEVKRGGKYYDVLGGKTVSREVALGIGSQITDTTLARTFRITPKKTMVRSNKPSVTFNKGKFRTFSQSQGKRRELSNTFIEKSKFALEKSERREASNFKFF